MATVLSNVASVPEWHQVMPSAGCGCWLCSPCDRELCRVQAAQNSREVGSWTIAELPTLLALLYSDDIAGRDDALHATGLLALDHANRKQLTDAGDDKLRACYQIW